jgi:hypothetical protein
MNPESPNDYGWKFLQVESQLSAIKCLIPRAVNVVSKRPGTDGEPLEVAGERIGSAR